MAPRRWLLLSLAILSLVVLVIGGVVLAYSVPVSDAMATAAKLPGDNDPVVGERAVAVPMQDPAKLATWSANASADPLTGRPGTLLLVADDNTDVPASSHNATVVRALAYVAPDKNGSYQPATLVFSNLTRAQNGNLTTFNATVAVTELALGKTGFLVKADAEPTIRFVEVGRVQGQVQGYVDGGTVWGFLVAGGLGFLLPITYLILTHRPTGTQGLPGGLPGVTGACPECRSPVAPGQDFCTRCGAWLSPKGGAPP